MLIRNGKFSDMFAGRWWSSSLYGSITRPRTPYLITADFATSNTHWIEGSSSSSHLGKSKEHDILW
jgi:hypothetical protein